MFCVLRVIRRENTLFERLFGRFVKDFYSLETVSVFKGAPFYILTATVGKNGVDWGKIKSMAGKCSQKLLYDGDIPQNEDIGKFKSRILHGKILMNTFVKILKNNCYEKHRAEICIIDSKGDNPSFAARLTKFAAKLTVVTDEKEKYRDICDEILDDTGLSVALCSEPVNANICIDLDNLIMTVKNKDGIFKITGGEGFRAEKIYEDILPIGIDKYDFFSALYELCGVFSLSEYSYDSIMVNSRKISTDSLKGLAH